MDDPTTSEATLRSLSLGSSRREETLVATWGDVSTHFSKSKGMTLCIFFWSFSFFEYSRPKGNSKLLEFLFEFLNNSQVPILQKYVEL